MRPTSLFRRFLVAAAFAGAAAGGAVAADHPLTLRQAIDLALQGNEEIAISQETLAAAEAGVSGARGAYDLQLGLSGGWQTSALPSSSSFSGAPPGELAPTLRTAEGALSLRQLLPTGGSLSVRGAAARRTTDGIFDILSPSYTTQVGAELRQPLLRGRSVDPARRSVRVARLREAEARAALSSTVTEVLAAVERSYWTLLAARLQLAVFGESVRLAEEQLDETQKRVESGTAPETELAQPRAELQRRTGDLLSAREGVSRAENALKRLILRGEDDDLWPERIVPVDSATVGAAAVDVRDLVGQALARRPEIAAREADLERLRTEGALARNEEQPALDAVLSYDRFGLAGAKNDSGPDDPIPPALDGKWRRSFRTLGDGDFNSARVALELGLPIRNRTARAAAAAAHRAARQAEAEVARTRKAVRAEVQDAAAVLETAEQRIAAARAGREAAEIQLAAERDRYDVGRSTNFLVLTRQNDLSRARLDEISALTDYRIARVEVSRATGSLVAEWGLDPERGRL